LKSCFKKQKKIKINKEESLVDYQNKQKIDLSTLKTKYKISTNKLKSVTLNTSINITQSVNIIQNNPIENIIVCDNDMFDVKDDNDEMDFVDKKMNGHTFHIKKKSFK